MGPGREPDAKFAVMSVLPLKTSRREEEEVGVGPVGRKVYPPVEVAFGHHAVS